MTSLTDSSESWQSVRSDSSRDQYSGLPGVSSPPSTPPPSLLLVIDILQSLIAAGTRCLSRWGQNDSSEPHSCSCVRCCTIPGKRHRCLKLLKHTRTSISDSDRVSSEFLCKHILCQRYLSQLGELSVYKSISYYHSYWNINNVYRLFGKLLDSVLGFKDQDESGDTFKPTSNGHPLSENRQHREEKFLLHLDLWQQDNHFIIRWAFIE